MKLTANELNYILSECMQYLINENTPNIDREVKQNFMGKIKNPPSTPNDKNFFDKIKGFGTKAKKFVKNNWGKAASATIGGLTALSSDTNGAIIGSLGMMLVPLISMVSGELSKLYNFKNKGVPNNINRAFELACKASKEYKNAANLCKIVQNNWNIACTAYKKVVAIKKQQGEQWTPAIIKWDSPEIQGQISKDFVLAKGDISGVKGAVDINQDYKNLKITEASQTNLNFQTQLNEAEIVNYLQQFDNANALKAMGQVAQLYSEAYKIYFEWRTYIAYIGKRYSITWDEIEKGELNNGAHSMRKKEDIYMGQFNQAGQNNILLNVISTNQQIGNKTYVIMQDVNDDEIYYGINTMMLIQHPYLTIIQNKGSFNAIFSENDFENNSLIYKGETLKLLNQNGLKKLQPTQQQGAQQQQATQQPQQQPQPQQSNPYGNYGGGWSSNSTY